MTLLLPLVAVGYLCGVALGARYEATSIGTASLEVTSVVGCAAVVTATLLIGLWRPRFFVLALTVATLSLGLLSVRIALQPDQRACHLRRHLDRGPGRFHLVVQQPARFGWHGQRQLGRVRLGVFAAGSVPLCGAVELLRHKRDPVLWPGQQLVLRSRPRLAVGRRNPGDRGPRLARANRGADVVMRAPEDSLVRIGRAEPPWIEGVRHSARGAIIEALGSGDGRAIVLALALGDRSELSPEARQRFARSGLSHLLAVSGLHLALVAGCVLWLVASVLRFVAPLAARIDIRLPAGLAAAAAALLYTLITGAAVPTARACLMALIGLACLAMGRAADWLRPFSLAALVLAAGNPLVVFRPGFQLSFLAVAGIVLAMGHPWARVLRAHRFVWVRVPGTMLVTTLGATLLTLPVVAYHFQLVSLAGPLANLLAVPWTSFVLLPSALLGALGTLLWPRAGEVALGVAGWAADHLARLAGAIASADVAAVPLAVGGVGALGLGFVAVAVLLPGRWSRRVAVALAVCALVLAAVQSCSPGEGIEATFIDVGQGDSTFVRLPDGTTVLVDAGGSAWGSFDPGRSRVVPFLRARGIQSLDFVVASHLDADHAAGLVAVLESVRVEQLWMCWPGGDNIWHQRLVEAASRRGTRIERPWIVERAGASIVPLWPAQTALSCGDPYASTNNNSIVLRVDAAAGSLLLPGDIDAETEQQIVAHRGADARATVLKVAHHGSDSSSDSVWLAHLRPRLAVISCGFGNRFGFPHARVLARLKRLGIAVARTDRMGSVTVRISRGEGVRWSDYLGNTVDGQ